MRAAPPQGWMESMYGLRQGIRTRVEMEGVCLARKCLVASKKTTSAPKKAL
jgi:hypothetical protein